MKNIYVIFILLSFTTSIYSQKPCKGTHTIDFAGKTYHTVRIGNQCWLKENLDAGTTIKGVDSLKNNGIIEKYCYNNDSTNCNKFGGLYTWDEAMQYATTPSAQGICPSGWHIPTSTEFVTLTKSSAVRGNCNRLKAKGQGKKHGIGTDKSGFSALLSGFRSDKDRTFSDIGNGTYFWSSTENGPLIVVHVSLYSFESDIYHGNGNKVDGFSVRCLRDK